MSYVLRDRSDGQVEIIFSRPVLIGVFPERDMAERVRAFLKDDQPELPDDRPAHFREAKADAGEAATDLGLSVFQLRGMWANHRRQMQTYMAGSGQQPCQQCQRPFTPSISNPETCARCSK